METAGTEREVGGRQGRGERRVASERALQREGERVSGEERDDARRSEDEGENERETTVGRVKAEGTYTEQHPSLVVQSALRTGVALPTLLALDSRRARPRVHIIVCPVVPRNQ